MKPRLTPANATERPAIRITGPAFPYRHRRSQGRDRPPRRGMEAGAPKTHQTRAAQEILKLNHQIQGFREE